MPDRHPQDGPTAARVQRHAPDLSKGAAGLPGLRTLRDFIRLATSSFAAAPLVYGHGQGSCYDEAVALVLWATHLPPDTAEAMFDAVLSPGEIDTILSLIEQRIATRRPLAYLTGEAWLHGLRFLSDDRALVPRSLLIEAMHDGLAPWLDASDPDWPAQILDLCTGGGSIAIHAAHHFEHAHVSAVDINDDALALCRDNVALHDLEERITLHRSDLLNEVAQPATFDLILCNPPYVPDASMARLPAEFRAEPSIALDGGADGMDLIHRILAQARDRLSERGVLLLEIGHEIDAFSKAFAQLSFTMLPVAAGEQMVILLTHEDLQHGSLAS